MAACDSVTSGDSEGEGKNRGRRAECTRARAAANAMHEPSGAPPVKPTAHPSYAKNPAPAAVRFNWSDAASRPLARAALETLSAAMAADPVNAWLLNNKNGSTTSGAGLRFAREELKGYLKVGAGRAWGAECRNSGGGVHSVKATSGGRLTADGAAYACVFGRGGRA